jgi:hypothetical protein
MDVFHKILVKAFEAAGDRDNAPVDLKDLLKREGFFSSIDSINEHLCGEGWATATDRQYVVKLTHWGIAEAKRTLSDAPDTNSIISKDAARLLSSARELVVMLEEFSAEPSKDKFKNVEKRFGDIDGIVKKIGANY